MDAQEIIDEWNRNHPKEPELADEAQRLLQMVANGDAEKASALAVKISEQQAKKKIESKKKTLEYLLEQSHQFDIAPDDADYMDDGNLGKIWSNAIRANNAAQLFQREVEMSWYKPLHEAFELYQQSVLMLCARWGFGNDVWSMLKFVIFDFEKYTGESYYTHPFLDYDFHYCGITGKMLENKLSNKEDRESFTTLGFHYPHLEECCEQYEKATNEYEEEVDISWSDARCILFGDDFYGEEDWQTTLCDAIYICFHPDALEWLSDAELALDVLIAFMNGATNNDDAMRQALLNRSIMGLKKELACDKSNVPAGEQTMADGNGHPS